jgi:hypothetical protein
MLVLRELIHRDRQKNIFRKTKSRGEWKRTAKGYNPYRSILIQHKLLRESIWMIPQDAGPDAEFDMMWETTSSFGDDDLEYMLEENAKKWAQ